MLERGNSEEFLELFIDGWEQFLTPFWEQEVPGIHLLLQPGTFLTDLKGRIDEAACHDSTKPVPLVRAKLAQEWTGFALYLSEGNENLIYRIQNIEDFEDRAFLYRLGRMVYEDTDLIPIIAPRRAFEEMSYELIWTDDRVQVLHFVKREKGIVAEPYSRYRWIIVVFRSEHAALLYHSKFLPLVAITFLYQ